MSTNEIFLVIGGAGKTGRRVAERLTERGVPVRLASRSSDPSFDWGDRSTWPPALEGATAAYITYYPDLAVEGSPERIRALAERAVAHGVRRLVLLSGRGEEEAERAEQELFVDAEDIADVAVAALTEDGHAGRLYELTGPRMLSFDEAVGEIARAAGRPIRYQPIPIDAFLGREPRDFAAYARRAAAAGAWSA